MRIKNIILVAAILMVTWKKTVGQLNHVQRTPPLVQVEWETDWGHKIMMHGQDYWTKEVSVQVKAQISEREFEKVKTSTKDMPCSMSLFCGKAKKNPDNLNAKLSKLKMYRIATYIRKTPDGKVGETMAILRVPYEGNENWDEHATWDTAYFLMPDQFIKEVGPGFVQKTFPEQFCFPEVSIKKATGIFPFDRNQLKDYNKDDVVTRQLGSSNMTHLYIFYGKPTYPKAFFDSGYKSTKVYNKKMSQLKAYQIAAFDRYEDQAKKTVKYVIVRIPYKGNENWAAGEKWDTNHYNSLFLILPAASVKKTSGKCIDNFGIDR